MMPPWTPGELEIAGQELFGLANEEISARFSHFGGITRFVFADELPELLDSSAIAAFASASPNAIARASRKLGRAKEALQARCILHMYPLHRGGKPYREGSTWSLHHE